MRYMSFSLRRTYDILTVLQLSRSVTQDLKMSRVRKGAPSYGLEADRLRLLGGVPFYAGKHRTILEDIVNI